MAPPTAPTLPSPRNPSRSRRRALVAVVGLAVASVIAAGCIPPPPAAPGALTPLPIGVTHSVSTRQVTFVDTSRPTPAFDAYPGSPVRSIPTRITYPSDGGGPFPLVIFNPGFGTTGANYASLITRIAAAGYVVAAPAYPLLSGQPAGPTDTVGWDDLAPDSWFVTSSVLDDPVVGGLIDSNRIAAAGHSDGAAVAFNIGYTPFKLDWRVRAVVAFSAGLQYYGWYQANGRPILHVLSDQDVYNPYGESIGWDRSYLQEPKTVLTLTNASHEGPYVNSADPHFELVVRMTIGFLDSAMKAHPEALSAAITYANNHPALGALGG